MDFADGFKKITGNTKPNFDMKKILVSGFGSFQKFSQNPSEAVVQTLENKKVQDVSIETILLPVSWKDAWPMLQEKCQSIQPDAWLGFGLAPEPFIRLETSARNIVDQELDIHGNFPDTNDEQAIVPGAPAILPSQLPLKLLNQAINRHYAQLPQANVILSAYSDHAGGYLCNHVFYNMLHHFGAEISLQGFIHLPAYPTFEGEVPYTGDDIVKIGAFLACKVAQLTVHASST